MDYTFDQKDVAAGGGPLEPSQEESTAAPVILILSARGQILTIVNPGPATGPSIRVGDSIESIWPPSIVSTVSDGTRKVLRTRSASISELDGAGRDPDIELMILAQGRDKVMLIARDISYRRAQASRMRNLAYVDPATTLPNRASLLDELGHVTDLLRLKQGRGAVVLIDIDQSGTRGGSIGPGAQNDILKVLASRLTRELRGANQCGDDDFERLSIVARIDYRQFGIVLPRIAGGNDAEAVAERLTDSLNQPISIDGRLVNISACAGIALFPQDGVDAETLFNNALAAVEDARISQSSHYKFHSGTVQLPALQRQDMELELKNALERAEFELNFLPIVNAVTAEVVAAEALLRWPHTMFGAQSIEKVVMLAEHTGLISSIGDWVIETALCQLSEWSQSTNVSVRLTINVSAQEFSQVDLASRIVERAKNHGISPQKIDVEINEYMLYRDATRNYASCLSLKEHGIGIVVDDYGRGGCSLADLAHSPVNAIKIDNSFVLNSVSNGRDLAACLGAVELAHALGLRVIAEGVEAHDQAQCLRECGCDELQGFFFSQPLDGQEFLKYLNCSGVESQAGNGDELCLA